MFTKEKIKFPLLKDKVAKKLFTEKINYLIFRQLLYLVCLTILNLVNNFKE